MPARPKTKTCTGPCGRTLPFTTEYFNKHSGYGKWGMETRCKACTRQDDKRKRQAKKPQTYPAPLLPAELEPRHRKMLEPSVAGFKAFFNEFATTDKKIYGLPAHAERWVAAALGNKRLLLNVPPRHAKTTIMAEWFVIWQFACRRDSQVIVVSKTDQLGHKIARKIAYELEFNSKLNMAFGRFRPPKMEAPWRVNRGEFQVEGKDLSEGSGDLSLQVKGSGQQILGMEADWIIADDVTDARISRSEAQRRGETEWFYGEVLTRLNPDGQVLCIGQRVHGEDLYGRLSQEKDEDGSPIWALERTPAILDRESRKVLWPEVWSWENLQETRRSIGGALFETMYQQNPEAAGEFVQRAWIEGTGDYPGCLDRTRFLGEKWDPDRELRGSSVTRVISIDPSPTKYCGIVVADVAWHQNQTVFACSIVDIRRGKYGLREMLDTIEELTYTYGPSVCIFEENSAKWLREDPAWNRLTPLFQRVVAHNTGRNKLDPVLGVWSMGADFEAGRIRLPYAGEETRQAMELLISEVLAYPNGQTDDVLMALWFIKPNFRFLVPAGAMQTRFSGGALVGGGSWKGW